jgi:hypothetical protein
LAAPPARISAHARIVKSKNALQKFKPVWVFVCLAAAEDAPSAPELGCCCGRRRDDDEEEEEEEEEEGKNTAMSVPYQPRLLPRRAILRSNRRKIMLVSSLHEAAT